MASGMQEECLMDQLMTQQVFWYQASDSESVWLSMLKLTDAAQPFSPERFPSHIAGILGFEKVCRSLPDELEMKQQE